MGGATQTPGWGTGKPMNYHPTKGAGDLTDYGVSDFAFKMLNFAFKMVDFVLK